MSSMSADGSAVHLLGPCDLWTGAKNRDGYGIVRHEGKTMLVHRVAWMIQVGPIPPETPQVLHRCDAPLCRNVRGAEFGVHDTTIIHVSARRTWKHVE